MSATEQTASGEGMPAFQPGSIMWHEIPVLSQPRAQTFYTTLFGWTFSPSPMPVREGCEPMYVLFSNASRSTNGGFLTVKPEDHVTATSKSAFGVRVTIVVEDINEALEAVEKAGGTVWTTKEEIPGGMGFTGAFKDTEGNVMGLWAKNDKSS